MHPAATAPQKQLLADSGLSATDYWGEAPYPTVTAIGVNWLAGFDVEIKVIAKLPAAAAA